MLRGHLAEDGAGQKLVLQKLRRQSVNMNSVQESMKVLGPALQVPAHPVRAGLIHLMKTRFQHLFRFKIIP